MEYGTKRLLKTNSSIEKKIMPAFTYMNHESMSDNI